MRMSSLKVWVLSLAICGSFAVAAEPAQKGLYIIFDASGSMWQKLPDGEFRIDAARRVLAGLAAGEYQGFDVAFRAYGHRKKGDCRDSELMVPFSMPESALPKLKELVKQIEVTVPVGHLNVVYQRADGTRDKDDRCFIGRGVKGRGVFKRSGEKIPLTAGTYNVTGWDQKGKYDPAVVEIAEGEDREVVLRAK